MKHREKTTILTEGKPARRSRIAIRHISERIFVCAVILSTGLFVSGCRIGSKEVVGRPARHSIRSDQLLILSDFKLPKDHPLVKELITLRKQISRSLDLPVQKKEVVVYIFGSEEEYREYLNTTYPGLPERRAYFVGTPRELAVYTFWGDRIQEDLRHEYTHGLLHAGMKKVPLWLDEGLAEYFEVAGPTPGTINSEYSHRLRTLVANSWRPDLKRLEKLEEFSQMQRVDYQEAWAWMHFLLHSSPESKDVLLGYLKDLREGGSPTPLSARLQQDMPQFNTRFLNYLASLNMSRILPVGGERSGAADFGTSAADSWWTIHK